MKGEGYLLIDHRNSPGITEEFIRSCGKDPADFLIVGEGKVLEAATLTCSHCQKVVHMSPTRKRERGSCRKCNKYICDDCNADLFLTGECKMVRAQMEKTQEAIALFEQKNGVTYNGTILLP
jgi:hypothetical protein